MQHPQLLLRHQSKQGVVYYPGFILSPRELKHNIQFPYVHPFGRLSDSYHPLELVPLPENNYKDFFSLQEEPLANSQRISAPLFVYTLLTRLCSEIEDHLRTCRPLATHYIFSIISWQSFFIDCEAIPQVTLEAHIEAFRFRDPLQRTFPFAAGESEQMELHCHH